MYSELATPYEDQDRPIPQGNRIMVLDFCGTSVYPELPPPPQIESPSVHITLSVPNDTFYYKQTTERKPPQNEDHILVIVWVVLLLGFVRVYNNKRATWRLKNVSLITCPVGPTLGYVGCVCCKAGPKLAQQVFVVEDLTLLRLF